MAEDDFAEISTLLETAESPDYQRIVAINIQVPEAVGHRRYHRVTITSSLRNLAQDLSLILPSDVRSQLRRSSERVRYRSSSEELHSPDRAHDPYVAACSCGESRCEHIDYAVAYFEQIQQLSTNIGRIAESFQLTLGRLRQVEEQWKTAEGKLLSLAQERDELTGRLKVAMESGKETEELRRLLRQKEAEIAEKGEQAENLRANIRAIYREGFRSSSSSVTSTETLSAETTSVVTRHFLPPSYTVSPDDKLQLNVAADHHRVSNTPFVVGRVAQFGFVREVGLGHRHNTKQGKVRPQRDVTRLELLVPYDGEADIVRVITTATCKEQQLLAAHLIGQAFEVEIQQPT